MNDGLAQDAEGSKSFVALPTGHVLVLVLMKWHSETGLQEQCFFIVDPRRPEEVGGEGGVAEVSKSGVSGDSPGQHQPDMQ